MKSMSYRLGLGGSLSEIARGQPGEPLPLENARTGQPSRDSNPKDGFGLGAELGLLAVSGLVVLLTFCVSHLALHVLS